MNAKSSAVVMGDIVSIAVSLGMRVGQLLANASAFRGDGHNPDDAVMAQQFLFYASDEDLLKQCRAYARSTTAARPDARSGM